MCLQPQQQRRNKQHTRSCSVQEEDNSNCSVEELLSAISCKMSKPITVAGRAAHVQLQAETPGPFTQGCPAHAMLPCMLLWLLCTGGRCLS
jgi:hypothetical protein